MATYADFSIKDRNKLKRYIHMKLGGGIITLPITDEQLDFCIDEALEDFTKWVHYDLEYYYLNVAKVSHITKDNPNGNYSEEFGFKLPNNVVGVSNIHEGANYWYSNSGSTMDFMMYNSGMYPTFNGATFSGNGVFLDVERAQNYIKQAQESFGYRFNFDYNERSKFLKLDPDPQKSRDCSKTLILEVHTIREEDQLLGESLVKKMSLAHAKMAIGTVYRTFGSPQLPGGGEINGDEFYSDGKEMLDECLEELKATQPPNFFFLQF